MKKLSKYTDRFVLTYKKGISTAAMVKDYFITILAWFFWFWLSYEAIVDFTTGDENEFNEFFATMGVSLQVALILAAILIFFGTIVIIDFFQRLRSKKNRNNNLKLEDQSDYFEVSAKDLSTARHSRRVDVHVDETGKITDIISE